LSSSGALTYIGRNWNKEKKNKYARVETQEEPPPK
jgi:hypothetical protein